MIRRFKEYLFDSRIDVQERLFMLLTVIAMTGMVIAFFISLAMGEHMEGLLSMLLAFIILLLIVYFGYKYNKVGVAVIIASVLIIYIFFPLVYFTSGGVRGGSPIWFLFALLYVGMVLRGKWKYFMLFSEVVIVSLCYYISYTHPETVLYHSDVAFYADSYGSLMVCSMILTLMTTFQIFMLRRETGIAREQKTEIDELNKAQNRFFSSMSHEIRTPINTIIGLNEMILRESDSEEVTEDAKSIQAASRMLLSLINDILDMSKIHSGQMQLTNLNYNLAELISEVASMIQIRAMEKGLNFEVSLAPDLPSELNGDEIRIKQILINLLNNAVKYTSEGSVSLSVQCDNLSSNRVSLVFSIVDTGMGIKKENIPYLFNAFKRVDEEKNRHIEGTGLGLSIVKELTELMHGKVTVNSIYTQGSIFMVEIPQEVVDATPVGRVDMYGRDDQGDGKAYHQSFEAPEAKILAVDDTKANLMVIKKLLRDTKVQLDTAESGEQALQLTLNNEYNIIFMDHLMPGMDGIECMKCIREQTGGKSRESRIVALTANADSKSRSLYEKSGFDGYVLKPVTGSTLETEVRRLLPKELVKFEIDDENVFEESVSWIQKGRKKANIKVTVTSIADIPKDMKEKYDIGVIPLIIHTEGGDFKDGVDMDSDAMLSYVCEREKKAGILPIGITDYERFFIAKLKQANNIIHIAASSRITDNSYDSAVEAAKNFDNVQVFDSESISLGQGVMAVEASRMAEEGLRPNEIIEELSKLKERINASYIVDRLDRLVGSGQLSGIAVSFVSAFMIRPVIQMRNGKIRVKRAFIGSRERAWKRYIATTFWGHRSSIDTKRLYICQMGLSKNDIDFIKNEIKKRIDFEEIHVIKSSPAIAVNVGMGAFGLLFITKDTESYY